MITRTIRCVNNSNKTHSCACLVKESLDVQGWLNDHDHAVRQSQSYYA